MRRVITADKVSVGFQYTENDKEVGVVRYNMVDGTFHIKCWPSSFTSLRRITELMKVLSLALRIVKSELV